MTDDNQITIDGKRPLKITLKVAISGGFGEEEFATMNTLIESIEQKVQAALPNTKVVIKI